MFKKNAKNPKNKQNKKKPKKIRKINENTSFDKILNLKIKKKKEKIKRS